MALRAGGLGALPGVSGAAVIPCLAPNHDRSSGASPDHGVPRYTRGMPDRKARMVAPGGGLRLEQLPQREDRPGSILQPTGSKRIDLKTHGLSRKRTARPVYRLVERTRTRHRLLTALRRSLLLGAHWEVCNAKN